MALIKRDGQVWAFTDDPYTITAEGEVLPDGAIAIPLARYLAEREAILARNAPFAVILSSNEAPDALMPDLHRINAVFLTFPKFRDGRGYSWSRMLRQRFGYRGEIRAIGDVLRDQWLFMHRCGVDAMSLRPQTKLDDFHAALAEQTVFYQPGVDGRGNIGRTTSEQLAAAE